MRELRRIDVQTFKNKRFQLEQMLAIELVAAFDKEASLLGPLKQMVSHALGQLSQMPAEQLQNTINAEDKLTIWEKRGLSLEQIVNHTSRLSAAECSDIIRLYSAAVEELGKAEVGGKQLDTLKKQYRPNPMKDFQDKDMIWDTQRYRVRGKKQTQIPEWHSLWQNESCVHGIDFKQAGKGVESGSSILSWSTVRKIDNAFGLPVGADISGTTADSLFFIERFARRCKIRYDPIYSYHWLRW